MRIVTALIFCLTWSDAARAQGQPKFVDGRFWNQMDLDSKKTYFIGFRDGLGSVPNQTIQKHWALGYSSDDYIREFDKVYSERENLNVPPWLMFRYITMKLERHHEQARVRRVYYRCADIFKDKQACNNEARTIGHNSRGVS